MLLWIYSLICCNSSILKQAVALCKCILLLHPSTPLCLQRLVSTRAPFQHHHLCYQCLLFFPLHLYVPFLLSAALNDLNHSVCLICTFFFHLMLLKNKKRWEDLIQNISTYQLLPDYALSHMQSEKDIWMNKENPLTSRKTTTNTTGN